MGLTENRRISVEEYSRMRETSEHLLEYINGIAYMSPSSSTKHQRTSMRLSSTLIAFLQGKPCEIFAPPYDVELKRDEIHENTIVIPDLVVICDKSGLTNERNMSVCPLSSWKY